MRDRGNEVGTSPAHRDRSLRSNTTLPSLSYAAVLKFVSYLSKSPEFTIWLTLSCLILFFIQLRCIFGGIWRYKLKVDIS